MNLSDKSELNNKRILSIDYGLKRTGIAVCDEFHITVTPLEVLDSTAESFLDRIIEIAGTRSVSAIVVGVPYRLDGEQTELIQKIEEFINVLKERIKLPIYEIDESYSTVNATKTLISIGRKKKKRSTKGEKDKIAAAIILRDFLEEN